MCSAEIVERIVYSASRTFFGGFSADENSAANTANGADLGVWVYIRQKDKAAIERKREYALCS